MIFATPTHKDYCVDQVKDAERELFRLREQLRLHGMKEHPAMIMSIHASQILAKIQESLLMTPIDRRHP